MGLLSRLLLAPVNLPMSSTLWLARKLSEAAETELNDPATLRAALAEAERRLVAGEMPEEEYDRLETDILLRLKVVG